MNYFDISFANQMYVLCQSVIRESIIMANFTCHVIYVIIFQPSSEKKSVVCFTNELIKSWNISRSIFNARLNILSNHYLIIPGL